MHGVKEHIGYNSKLMIWCKEEKMLLVVHFKLPTVTKLNKRLTRHLILIKVNYYL